MARQRIFITGASGFIGACLMRELIASGEEVHILVRRETSPWRLDGLDGQYELHHADLRDLADVRRAVDACRPDVVYHLAAHGTLYGEHDRAAVFDSNVSGTCNLLEALGRHDYRRLVHVGSSSEYGHKSGPMREGDRLEPRSDYAVSKAAATLLVQAEAFKGRPVTTVRVFSAYGPWEAPTRLIPYVMECCLRGERPQVTDGGQPRDFIHVDDCVALLLRAAATPAAAGQILHAGTGRPQTVRSMVDLALQVCTGGYLAADYGAQPTPCDEPHEWVADINRTISLTGWRPSITPEQGLKSTWEWYEARFAALVA
jgi:nucleoside-diphosphate-sugar epimerase